MQVLEAGRGKLVLKEELILDGSSILLHQQVTSGLTLVSYSEK